MDVIEIMARAIDEWIGDSSTSDEMANMAIAALVDAGFAVVPVVPSEEMTAKGGDTLDCADSIDAAQIYGAMIEAGKVK